MISLRLLSRSSLAPLETSNPGFISKKTGMPQSRRQQRRKKLREIAHSPLRDNRPPTTFGRPCLFREPNTILRVPAVKNPERHFPLPIPPQLRLFPLPVCFLIARGYPREWQADREMSHE